MSLTTRRALWCIPVMQGLGEELRNTWWRDDYQGSNSLRGKSVRHGHSRDRGQRLVETLGWHHRAVPQAVLCVMCYAARRGERGLMH
jgi:hypothetical protein